MVQKSLQCPTCGSPSWTGVVCNPCRKSRWTKDCHECGRRFTSSWSADQKYCSHTCAATSRARSIRIRSDDDHRVTRQKRERAAAGLSVGERKRLLDKWKRQGATCAYWPREGCQRIATEVDHVVPLVRGGTNYEGNLTPACKHCNSSKGGLTVIEWRTGKRLPQMVKPVTHKRKPKPVKVKPLGKPVQTMLNICPECGGLCVNKYCDNTCATRYAARANYRRRAGIPIDAPLIKVQPRGPRARAA